MLLFGALHSMEEQCPLTRIMTFNIRRQGKEKNVQNLWEQRKKRVENLIKQVNPDFMGLQEPTKEQIEDLAQMLNQYAWFGKGRGPSWGGLGENEYNPIFYSKDRFELLDHGTFSINACSKIEYAWDPKKYGLLPRICTWGKFKDKKSGQQLYVYNTHLDHKFQKAQLHGLATIIEFMNAQKEELPIILMGDFNTELSPEIKNTLPAHFKDAKELAQQHLGPQETRTGWDFEELKKIDHILFKKSSAPISVLEYKVIEEANTKLLPSDHRPVVVDICLK